MGFADSVTREWIRISITQTLCKLGIKVMMATCCTVDKSWEKVLKLKDAVAQPKYVNLSIVV